jgi:hypothetical protein
MLKISYHDVSSYISMPQWEKNLSEVSLIKQTLSAHKVFKNPCIHYFQKNQTALETIKKIHLDYRCAIVQIFTDALLAAAYQSKQLEETFNLPAGIKMIPRFLLTPNFQDEFGIYIKNNHLAGSPLHAHYPLFENVLKDLQVTTQEKLSFTPSSSAKELRAFLESHYQDFLNIVALLAAAELQVVIFSPILKNMLDLNHIDTATGYYFVHGASTETGGLACDDEHADDLWRCLALAINFRSSSEIETVLTHYLDLWDDFWTHQLSRVSQ